MHYNPAAVRESSSNPPRLRSADLDLRAAHSGQLSLHFVERPMIHPLPVTLEGHGVRLEPLTSEHAQSLCDASADGRLWELWFTTVPEPEQVEEYIATALAGQAAGEMLPWAVRDLASDTIVGTTRYHDIIPVADRVEIGYTWYAARCQRTHINTACKLLLLRHGFETLRCSVIGLRTDNFNFRSQRAIEDLGAKRDGVIRRHFVRRDGSLRDTVMYSIIDAEWGDVQKHLQLRLTRHRVLPA